MDTPKLVITEMWAYIAQTPEGEGVVAIKKGIAWMPLVGADLERIQSMRPMAERLAKQSGQRMTLVRFTTRTELDVIEP